MSQRKGDEMTYEDATKPHGKAMRRPQVLDIPDLARRGGLSSDVAPYRMGENSRGIAYLEASGNSTVTVNQYACLALEGDVENARHYVRTYAERNPDVIAESFRSIAIMPNPWIKRVIVKENLSPKEAAQEIYSRNEAHDERLRQWQPAQPKEPLSEIAARRQGAIKPLLKEKHWTIEDWAKTATVDWKTANNYLLGKTLPREYVAAKLAAAIGLEHLPL
jgi:hypothetical protein